MRPLPFLDRVAERERLDRALDHADDSLVCIYGRRRLGKSRLLRESLVGRDATYFVGDARDAHLHRESLGREIERQAGLTGFGRVTYPGWSDLLDRWWDAAPRGAVLALDEFPHLVRAAAELPSLLQVRLDSPSGRARKIILCGSSQEMMQGLVLDPDVPLYGRAEEILPIGPLDLLSLQRAFGLRRAADVVETHATWGGVPRYWELARNAGTREAALERLVLDPFGVLHREPERLLRDDLQETARASSLLALIGRGCHRISEIGGRLGQPATSLSRPLQRLVDLGFVRREVPWGRSLRDTKRTSYRLADPFLQLWYRFVEPNRSQLAAGDVRPVLHDLRAAWSGHVGMVWEDLVRASIPRLEIAGRHWRTAARWWGNARDGGLLELDAVAEAVDDPSRVLVAEAKSRVDRRETTRLLAELTRRARACPALADREVTAVLFVLEGARRIPDRVLTASDVVGVA